jgi:hypothetical protein
MTSPILSLKRSATSSPLRPLIFKRPRLQVQFASSSHPAVEVMTLLTDFLTFHEHIQTRQVCRSWYHKANHESVVGRVCMLMTGAVHHADTSFVDRELPKVKSLVINRMQLPSVEQMGRATRLTKLRYNFDGNMPSCVRQSIASIPNLLHLSICWDHYNVRRDDGLLGLPTPLSSVLPIPKLQSIELDFGNINYSNNESMMHALAELVGSGLHMHTLKIGCHMMDLELLSTRSVMENLFHRCQSVTTLSLECSGHATPTLPGTTASTSIWADIDKHMPQLQNLRFNGFHLSVFEPICGTKLLSRLIRLELSSSELSRKPIRGDVLAAIVCSPTLQIVKTTHIDLPFMYMQRQSRKSPLVWLTCACVQATLSCKQQFLTTMLHERDATLPEDETIWIHHSNTHPYVARVMRDTPMNLSIGAHSDLVDPHMTFISHRVERCCTPASRLVDIAKDTISAELRRFGPTGLTVT